jgi:hypothetical protein
MDTLKEIVEKLTLENDKKAAANPMIRTSLKVVADFLKTHEVMCYGGTAINNLLPAEVRFYDPETTIPDYDFYSKMPQEHAMMLADKLKAVGIESVEVKPGMHLGTFKVFADYEGVADITHLDGAIFDRLWKEDLTRDGIHYVTPNFLRMSMYLELSRPQGDVSRWEKVYSRLQLLNEHYPISCPKESIVKQRPVDDENRKKVERILETKNVVLLGITASQIHEGRRGIHWAAPITLLAEPSVAEDIAKGHTTERHEGSEILPAHIDVLDSEGEIFIRIHETAACHSFHQMANGIKVASIPTLLQFMFAYLYADVHEDEVSHLICIAQRLVDLAAHKEERRYAILTPIDCIGDQETLIDMKRHKAELYKKLSADKTSVDFLTFFFTYTPDMTPVQKTRLKAALKKTRKARLTRSY